MPWLPGYEALMKGKVADLSNMASSRYGGGCSAAWFLKKFV